MNTESVQDNDYTDEWPHIRCALYGQTSVYYTNIIRTKGTKIMFRTVSTLPFKMAPELTTL